MRFALRLAGAAALVLGPMSYASAQNAGKTLAMDFRTTVTIQGTPDTGVITGHGVVTADKMRLDVKMKGTSAQVSPLASDSAVSIIVTDTGKTIAYLDLQKNQYRRVRPTDMIAQAQQMGGMKMEFTDTKAQVDSFGAGPVILGHPTSHYRIATGMTVMISAMGQQQTVKVSSSNDSYYATDIKGVLNPFSMMTGGDMANMFGTTNKDFADKMKAAIAKLPTGVPLRATSSNTLIAQGQTRVTNSQAEITSVKWVGADPKAFEIPSTYTAVEQPTIGGSGQSGAIPPQ